MNYIFSAERNLFYPYELKKQYEQSGDWPEKYIEVEDDVFREFISYKEGKVRVAGDDGMPAWADTPPPSYKEMVALAEQKKQELLDHGLKTTAIWRAELQLGVISDADKEQLMEWVTWYKSVQDVDTKEAPNIVWAEMPKP
ncbi:tail fiber assembly protein [Escherichia coli]|uniref:tail fiber assembly protein n=1 Tax=Escherichia coli TaxID=562 RepID=UPI000B7D35BE|nr:tail fiber assembly protein [Escherichia coli]MBC0384528.1 tail fiber assembly protein [Escherichia coli]HBV7788732.1 tail fiber assembly protein [Escherichia coli]